MELKSYQRGVIADLTRYLELLAQTRNISRAYELFWREKGLSVGTANWPSYQNYLAGVPCVCAKVPTGGGKTFVACHAVKPVFEALPLTKTKAVVWLVPSEAILSQTLKALGDPSHPYRQRLDIDFGGRVAVYSKQQLLLGQNFSPVSVAEQLSICVLSYDSFRGRKENLKARQENSNLAEFAKVMGRESESLENADDTALLQVLNGLNPLVIVDESHHAKSALSKQMLRDFNPCLVLELTATPKAESNIISLVDALQLKRENMVKLPVIVYNRDSQAQVLSDSVDLRRKLEELAQNEHSRGGPYLRPIALFQAQPKGAKDNTTFAKVREKLRKLDIPAEHIAIRTAEIDELKNWDLLAEDCPIRYIITVNALKEGWDCPFAYILASLANRTSTVEVEQILGRILRLPYARPHGEASLNMSYVLTSSADFSGTLKSIVAGLNAAGFSEKDYRAAETADPAEDGKTENSEIQPGELPDLKANRSTFPDTLSSEDEDAYCVGLFGNARPQTEGEQGAVSESSGCRSWEQAESGSLTAGEDESGTAAESVSGASANMLAQAARLGQAYTASLQAVADDAYSRRLPWEVKKAVPSWPVQAEFAEEIKELRLPQFMYEVPESIFYEGHFELLERETLAKDFTLKGKSADIDFASADTELVAIDIRSAADDAPKVYKMSNADQRYLREYFAQMPQPRRIAHCQEILRRQLSKFNHVADRELIAYIERVVGDMNSEQLAGLEKAPLAYAQKIRAKVEELLEEHYEKQFGLWLETGRIQGQANYALPSAIHPARSTSMYAKSLYAAEEEPDSGLERELIMALTALPNLRWWHRNIARQGFRINGFINHYPDFIIRTRKGTIVAAETKGEHLQNRDSLQKVRLGRLWQTAAGKDYRYYMVYEDTDTVRDGVVSMSSFLKIMADL
ncbi:MAG: DEAD/DEAH box helicase family protein [bacterium]|nr:DEAD/DEAH box helicase family protein [bacterium]